MKRGLNKHHRSENSYFYGSTDGKRNLGDNGNITLLCKASHQFLCYQYKQIRETRRNPVPKQRCISVPHSGSGRGLSSSRLRNRIEKVCGTVWDAQSSFWWHLVKSLSSWAAITSLYDENHCLSFFQAFMFLIYLPSRAIRAGIRPFWGCTAPGNRNPWIQREDLWCDCNTNHNSNKQPGQKPKFSSCQLPRLVFVSLNTSPPANRTSATRIRQKLQHCHGPRAHVAVRWGVTMCTGEPPNTPWVSPPVLLPAPSAGPVQTGTSAIYSGRCGTTKTSQVRGVGGNHLFIIITVIFLTPATKQWHRPPKHHCYRTTNKQKIGFSLAHKVHPPIA